MSIVAENTSNIPVEEQQSHIEDKRVMEKYALLSNVSYDTYYHDVQTAQKNLSRYLSKHKINPNLTDNNSSVIEAENGDVVISYRGTNPFNPSDVLADIEILSGLPISSRFNESLLKYDLTKKQYPNRSIKITGHSLGGSEGLHVAKERNAQAYLYNVGSSPVDILHKKGQKNIYFYHTIGDLISLSNKTMSHVKNVEPKNIRAIIAKQAIASGIHPIVGAGTAFYNEFIDIHGLHNFMPDDIYSLETFDPTDTAYKSLLSHKNHDKNNDYVYENPRNMTLYEKPKKLCIDKQTQKIKFCN
jgi:hypothetical protein